MTLQPVRFGALTSRQEHLVSHGLPSAWQAGGVFSTRQMPVMDVVDFMLAEGDKILGDQALSPDTFTPNGTFKDAEQALIDYFNDALPDDNASPLEIIRAGSAGSTLPLDQHAAGQVLDILRNSQSCYVSDNLIHALLRVIQG